MDVQLLIAGLPDDPPGSVRLQRVKVLAQARNAVAAINGYNWDGPEGDTPLDLASLTTTTIFFENLLSNNNTDLDESLMGFARGGPSGLQTKRIPRPLNDDTEFNRPENLPFRYHLYGSNSSVLRDGVCQSEDQRARWSVVGYSPSHIVFLSTASEREYRMQEFCPTLHDNFGVTDAVRNDGGPSTSLFVGGPVNRLVNPLTGTIESLIFGDSRNVGFAVAVVPRETQIFCSRAVDSAGVAFAALCVTAENAGYNAELIMLNDGMARCGAFQFKMVSRDGTITHEDQGPFEACSDSMQLHSFFFDIGTLGGCGTLHLLQRSGHDFGFTEWATPACGEPGGPVPPDPEPDPGPDPVDATPPTTTAVPGVAPNSSGWNNTDVTISFSATDAGDVVSGVRSIHVSLSGAQTGSIVIPGSSGSVTISAEGTTHVSYFAIDNAGNAEARKTLTLRVDKTPPQIVGLPGPDCSMWPPNHRLVEVATVSASDPLSGMAAFDLGVTSNEPGEHHGAQFVITGTGLQPRVVELRAEREGRGDGRVYTITATARDIAGNAATADGTCTVPHDQRN